MTTVSRHPGSRVVRLTLSCVVVSGLLLATDAPADAQSRHARVSRDLEQRLQAGDIETTSVIVAGSRERIGRIAARHGLRITQELQTGAVLEVPAGALSALANDTEVDSLSSKHLVEAHMGVTNQTIGADLVQQGGWAPGIGPLTGAGIGVAVIDSGVSAVPELRGRIIASKDFTDSRGLGIDQHGTARTSPASSPQRAPTVSTRHAVSRRAQTSSASRSSTRRAKASPQTSSRPLTGPSTTRIATTSA